MGTLNQYPHLSIDRVAEITGQCARELAQEQLLFLKSVLKRNSELWNIKAYGR